MKNASAWVVMVIALGLPTLITWVYFVTLADDAPGLQQAAYLIGKVSQFALPVVWVLLIQRQRPKFRGPSVSELIQGAVTGVLIVAAMLALYFLWFKHSPAFADATVEARKRIDSFGLHGPGPFLVMGVFYSLVHSLLEEYYWRWFVFGELKQLTLLWDAIVVSGLGFMGHHVLVIATYFGTTSPETVFLCLSVAVGGMIWAWQYNRRGSLYATWISHLLVDAGIFAIGFDMVRR